MGSYFMSRYADRIKNLPQTYALLKMGIGMYGVMLILVFNGLPTAYIMLYNSFHTDFYLFSMVQFLLIFFALMYQ